MSLATSYAQALYESAKELGADSQKMSVIEAQMDSFQEILEASPDLSKLLFGPVVSIKEKLAVIDAIAQRTAYLKTFVNFLHLLVIKDRLRNFEAIRDGFAFTRLAAEGGVSGKLVSADPMNESDVSGLAVAFGRKLGKTVAFRSSTDPALLAGLKVTINGVTYDGTLKSKLQQLRDVVVGGYAAR